MKWTLRFRQVIPLLTASLCLVSLSGCSDGVSEPFPALAPDLTVYTCQEEAIYGPIVKEFQERTGMRLQVEAGNFLDLEKRLEDGSIQKTYDVVFGVNAATLEQYQDEWAIYKPADSAAIDRSFRDSDYRWTGFSLLPMVIIYNTKVVTYRELPDGWHSLLEPRWKNRVAFVGPEHSALYATALVSAMETADDPDGFLAQLAENMDYASLDSLSEVSSAVAEGRCSVGVTLEEEAALLARQRADIDYVYPSEGFCLVPDGSAIVAASEHQDAAAAFLDFTISRDTQWILVSQLNRRSVRNDVLPAAGLPSVKQLVLLPLNYSTVFQMRAHALDEWQSLFSRHTKKTGGDAR